MGMTEEAPAADIAPDNLMRAALARAIADREGARVRYLHLEKAEQLGRELCGTSERVLLAFCDVDAIIVQHRAEVFKSLAMGVPNPESSLPNGVIARQAMRDAAREQVTTAKATYETLVADLNQARSTLRQAGLNVAVAAFDVLMAEGVKRAADLKATSDEVWRQFDRLSALADCQLHYDEASFPIKLPLEIVSVCQTIAALDRREFADGCNDAAVYAGELWCCWFETLLKDPEAEITFDCRG
jgi:hypothetical protein